MEPIDSVPQINHVEVNINEFIHNNRTEKEIFHHLRTHIPDADFSEVYSYINTPVDVDEEHNRRLDHRSIIPDSSNPLMQPKLEHLSSEIQQSTKSIIAQHKPILARNKHQLGYFKHFQVTALIDDKSKINCKQPCRTRILPA